MTALSMKITFRSLDITWETVRPRKSVVIGIHGVIPAVEVMIQVRLVRITCDCGWKGSWKSPVYNLGERFRVKLTTAISGLEWIAVPNKRNKLFDKTVQFLKLGLEELATLWSPCFECRCQESVIDGEGLGIDQNIFYLLVCFQPFFSTDFM